MDLKIRFDSIHKMKFLVLDLTTVAAIREIGQLGFRIESKLKKLKTEFVKNSN